VLEASYIVRRLRPLARNVTKRQVKAPKLHFLDTGLLCYLLGISSPEHLVHHPLRGAVFETWVASEIVKARASAGLERGLHFYRDRKGVEVDLVVDEDGWYTAVEIKSGRTIASDFFRNLDLFARRAGSTPVRSVLVHAGEASGTRHGTRLVPWHDVASTAARIRPAGTILSTPSPARR
jgi:predicted AAA+ superfamily ATPase